MVSVSQSLKLYSVHSLKPRHAYLTKKWVICLSRGNPSRVEGAISESQTPTLKQRNDRYFTSWEDREISHKHNNSTRNFVFHNTVCRWLSQSCFRISHSLMWSEIYRVRHAGVVFLKKPTGDQFTQTQLPGQLKLGSPQLPDSGTGLIAVSQTESRS